MAVRPWTEVHRGLQVAVRAGAVGGLTDRRLLERFLAKGDESEAAFEALVARHGGMVMSVCRGLLGTSHDAEDAFQATFLVLVRRAEAIRNQDSLSCWLHGVARRVALRARENGRRRERRESERARPEGIREDNDRAEVAALIHEEIARLPEHYRTAVLLCELGGRTHAEAAAQLSCPVGTVSGRVARAKGILKERFARRGLIASSIPAAAARVDSGAVNAAVQARLILAGSEAASRLASAVLADRVRRLAALAAGVLAWTTSTLAPSQLGDRPVAAPRPVARLAPVRSTPNRTPIVEVTIAPDGKTFAAVRADSSVTIWDIESDRERFTFRGHGTPLLSLKFSPDGSSVTTSDSSRELKVWTTESGREQLSMTLPPSVQGDPVAAAPTSDGAPSGA